MRNVSVIPLIMTQTGDAMDPLDVYLQNIQGPLLTLEQEQELGYKCLRLREQIEAWLELLPRRFTYTQIHSFQELIMDYLYWREQLVTANLRLVISIAKRMRHSPVPFWDLIQEGNIGLLKAVDKYDPSKARFSTYATWWIRQSIMRYLDSQRQSYRIPSQLLMKIEPLRRFQEEFLGEHERLPTVAEVATALAIDYNASAALLRSLEPTFSLDHPLPDTGNGATFLDLVVVAHSEQEEVEDRSDANEILACIPSPRDREILCKLYGFDDGREKTLEEVGQYYGLTRERVRQLKERALRQLKIKLGVEIPLGR